MTWNGNFVWMKEDWKDFDGNIVSRLNYNLCSFCARQFTPCCSVVGIINALLFTVLKLLCCGCKYRLYSIYITVCDKWMSLRCVKGLLTVCKKTLIYCLVLCLTSKWNTVGLVVCMSCIQKGLQLIYLSHNISNNYFPTLFMSLLLYSTAWIGLKD